MEAAIQLMVTVLAAKLGRSRTVLVFDDVHWMDSSSWTLVRAVMKDVKPILVLLNLRPMAEPYPTGYAEVEQLTRSSGSVGAGGVVRLEGLSEPEIHALLLDYLGVRSLPPQMLKIIWDKSDGNPLWAMEFVKLMQEAQMFSTHLGECELLVNVEEVQFPSSVEALVTSRMDRLKTAQQLIMKMASVMGTDFSIKMLEFLAQKLELDLPADMSASMRKLCSADMVVPQSQTQLAMHPDRFSFKHKYLQDVAYSLLPEELKETLHRAAGEFYERSHINTTRRPSAETRRTSAEMAGGLSLQRAKSSSRVVVDDSLGKLCYHWSKAGEAPDAVERAVGYLKLAGDHAFDSARRRPSAHPQRTGPGRGVREVWRG